MKWMEEIRVRTQPRMGKEVMELLLETAASVSRSRKPQSVSVYSHQFVPGGFSLLLFWNTATVPPQGSETAMFILEGLKPLGLLDHSILVERGNSEEARVKKKGGSEGAGPRHPVARTECSRGRGNFIFEPGKRNFLKKD